MSKKAIYGLLTMIMGIGVIALITLPSLRVDSTIAPLSQEMEDLKEVVEKETKAVHASKTADRPMSEKKKKVKGHNKMDNPNLFDEYHRGIRTKDGDEGPNYDPNYKFKALLKAHNVKTTEELADKAMKTENKGWTERGPGNVTGRTRGLLVAPWDPNHDTWYAGTVGGGVWKTTDAGQTWENLTKHLPNLATSALAMAPSDPDYIYVGTGEGFGNVDQIDGSGIWRSKDGGYHWKQIPGTANNPEFENVMRMVVHPKSRNYLVVAVAPGFNAAFGQTSGIYVTEDAGRSWTKTYTSAAPVQQVIMDHSNPDVMYATVNGVGVIKSYDAGYSWQDASNGISGVGRVEIAQSPKAPNRLFISCQGGSSGSILYVTSNGGATWNACADVNGADVHWLGGQGWYDNTIAVHPYNKSRVFVGGINLWDLELTGGEDSTSTVTGVDLENTSSFLAFVNFGGGFGGGGIDLGGNVHGQPTELTDDEYTSIEIRFGPGKSQKAHRFLFGGGWQYAYQDYTDVPFEVWDIDNNQQLMVSYRDHEDNGVFDLEDRATDPLGIDREYIFVHAIPYNDTDADASVAVTGGQVYKNTYFLWPEAPFGTGTIDPSTLTDDATVRINYGVIVTKLITTTNVTDAYGQFGGLTKNVHPDHHNIILIPTDPSTGKYRFLNANDGGVAVSDDAADTFLQTGSGGFSGGGLGSFNSSQFYGVDKAPGISRYVGGTQDNSSWVSPEDPDEESTWVRAPSGDGFQAAWNYGDVNKIIESSQFNNFFRSLDGGLTWNFIGNFGDAGNGPFYTKIANSKQDPDLIFVLGPSGVWRSDNFADSWTLTSMPAGYNGTSSFSHVEISVADPQIVWTAQSMTAFSPVFVSDDGGLSFEATPVFPDVPLGRISGIATHPTEPHTAYVLFSFAETAKILRTTDLGQTWEDISGFGTGTVSTNGFPDVAVYSLVVQPDKTENLFVGTEIGLFFSVDNGATWQVDESGLPATAVFEMTIVDDEVVAATHGRGVWTYTYPGLKGYKPPVATLAPRFKSLAGGAGGFVTANVRLASAYDSTEVLVDGAVALTIGANSGDTDSTLALHIETTELKTVTVSLVSYVGGREYKSPTESIEVFPLGDPVDSYAADFDDLTSDFIGSGITAQEVTGFSNGALHTAHNYANNSNLTAILTVPITVASSNATVSYDDVAIIEPGDPGSVFGDANFWDYVILEGSNDNGSTWTALADGYDARQDADWEAAYNAGTAGDESHYRTQTVDLLSHFAAGDEVILRFRLFADGFVVGWGWAIDNISIQEDAGSLAKSDELLPEVFSLDQNYPNPFNPTTTINFRMPKTSDISIKVYNVLGQKVRTLVDERREAGTHTLQWDGRNDAGVQVSSGMYFYRMQADGFVDQRKMMLLK